METLCNGCRLLRKVDIDASNPAIRPNYERWGYGVKAGYDGEKFSVGGTIFTARDKQRDISFDADALGIYPKGNNYHRSGRKPECNQRPEAILGIWSEYYATRFKNEGEKPLPCFQGAT